MTTRTTMARAFAAMAAIGALFAAMLMFAGGASARTTAPQPGGGVGGVQVNNPHPQAGGSITVSGQGCTPGSPVTVSVDGSQAGSGTTDSSGAFGVPVTVASNASPGHHTVSVAGANCSGVLGIEVVAPASASGGGTSLASTGVEVAGISALGLVLLVGGTMLLLAGRRRRHTDV